MQTIAKILLLSLGLAACGTATDSRYRDTAMLERPPSLAVSHQPGEQSRTTDDHAAQKTPDGEDLEATAYMTTATPPLLVIKQPYDQAWDTLGHALKQDFLKVTERQPDKGLYFVSYDPEAQAEKENGIFDKTLSLFQDKLKEEHYILTVTAKGEETEISAAINKESKQDAKADNKDDNASTPAADGAEKLLLSIYKTMSNKPQKEKEEKEEKKSRRRHKD